MDSLQKAGDESRKFSCWHAAGVGVVKSVSEVGGAERVQALKSFTPGK
ncbi:hypothetical protein [Zavarzinella formosa]|nr:hypothetical protein [Zavarzinella formosa]